MSLMIVVAIVVKRDGSPPDDGRSIIKEAVK